MSCSSSLLCWVGGCKQGPRNPSTHTAQPCPTQVLHHLCLSPGLPLPSVLEEMTGKKGLEEKKTWERQIFPPQCCALIYLMACCLVLSAWSPWTLPSAARALQGGTLQGLERLPLRSPKPLSLSS